MSTKLLNGVNLYYEEWGDGEETIFLSHGLLWSHKMFAKQVDFLKSKYKVIVYDHRGQGQSEGTDDGYDMDTLSEDAIHLINYLSPSKPVIFGGLSMGGFVGMRLAARYPDRIKKLILMNTSCETEPEENKPKYKKLNFMVRFFGISIVVPKVMPIMFGTSFLNNEARKEEYKTWSNEMKSCRKKFIVKAVDGVINRTAIAQELHKIQCPTLIIYGDQDVATTPVKAEKIHSMIQGSKMIKITNAGHSSTIEEPDQVNKAIENFLD